MLIPSAEISELQGVFVSDAEGLLSQLATIKRRTLASDGEGGQTESFATVASNVPCLVSRERQALDTVEAGALANQQLWRIRFLSTVDVRETDQIEIGSRTYVVAGPTGVGSLAVLNRVLCRALK